MIVPFRETPYLIDGSIIMHSDNRIEAQEKAVIRQKEGVKVLLIRNEHVVDLIQLPAVLPLLNSVQILEAFILKTFK